jgi:hypothetical protein
MGRCTWRNDANAYAASSGVRFQRQQMHQKLGCAPGLAGEEGGLTDASRCGFWGFGGLLSGLKRPETLWLNMGLLTGTLFVSMLVRDDTLPNFGFLEYPLVCSL